MKENCWEFKKCGRQPGGARAGDLGICPSSLEKRLDGVHEGKNAGRACWVVAGTFCRGEMKCIFAKNIKSCSACDFYKAVRREEFPDFQLSAVILEKLRESETIPRHRVDESSLYSKTLPRNG